MANFGTRTILINDLSAWGVTVFGDQLTTGLWSNNDVLVKIPGFGAFSGGDDGSGNIIKASRYVIAGAAATPGVWTVTIAGDLSDTPSTVSFVIDYKTQREEAVGARLNQAPGRTFPFTVRGGTPTVMAAAVKAQMEDNDLFMSLFSVEVAAGVLTITAKDSATWIELDNTGFAQEPYVEDASTGRELPGVVTAALAETTAPAEAKGLGKDLEEDEFLDTIFTVQPYKEEITDRPIKAALYNEVYFEIPTTNEHEEITAPSTSTGRRGISIYILKSEWNAALDEAFGVPA